MKHLKQHPALRERLKEWRERRGWTQQRAGEWWGLPAKNAARTWRRWESGDRRIPMPLVQRVGLR